MDSNHGDAPMDHKNKKGNLIWHIMYCTVYMQRLKIIDSGFLFETVKDFI